MKPVSHVAGLTLVELVIAIVIVSVAFVGMMSVYASLISRSADPMIYQQSVAIADSFMEEIAAKDYPVSFNGSCPLQDDSDRSNYLDVCDYHGFSTTGIEDIAGNDLGLDGYGVNVEVAAAGSALSIIDNNDAIQITVTVSHPLGDNLVMTSYRARY